MFLAMMTIDTGLWVTLTGSAIEATNDNVAIECYESFFSQMKYFFGPLTIAWIFKLVDSTATSTRQRQQPGGSTANNNDNNNNNNNNNNATINSGGNETTPLL